MYRLLLIATLLVSFSTGHALAASANAKGKVIRTMTDANNFGGCMVLMDLALADKGLDCRSGWVTFDCEGVSGEVTKSAGKTNFEIALMAKLTQGRVEVLVTDEVKINGWCLGTRTTLF